MLRSFFSAPVLAHMPMHGPQAFAKTFAPILENVSINPSRSMVKRTFSEPGVMLNSALGTIPFSAACFANDAAREISS